MFAAGINRIARFDGFEWIDEYTSPAQILSLNGGDAGIHAVGGDGLILRRDNAGAWTTVRLYPPVAADLHAYASRSSERGYIVENPYPNGARAAATQP